MFIYPLSTYYTASGHIFYIHAPCVACASFLTEEAGLSQKQQLPPVLSYPDATVKS